MSFSFNFHDEESDGDVGIAEQANVLANYQPAVEPELVNLEHLLESLVGTRLTYEEVNISGGYKMFRREFSDVKHQLMMEDDSSNEEVQVLLGQTNEDLRSNVYEGGLKSWECAYDVVNLIKSTSSEVFPRSNRLNMIEIGCGTSLPTCSILEELMNTENTETHITLTDYNAPVLRLVTVPNLIINWALKTLEPSLLEKLQQSKTEAAPGIIIEEPVRDGEIFLSKGLISSFVEDLIAHNITMNLISGGWSEKFLQLVKSSLNTNIQDTLIITSETIYQPTTLPVISEILIELTTTIPNTKTLVAAKDIYFGVGGSVVDFTTYLDSQIKQRSLDLAYRVERLADVPRSLIHLSKK